VPPPNPLARTSKPSPNHARFKRIYSDSVSTLAALVTCQHVPTGQVGKMTTSKTLVLNVGYVNIAGTAGEPEFGSPHTLKTHYELNEWMEGLL
jgi:hypothetical protein